MISHGQISLWAGQSTTVLLEKYAKRWKIKHTLKYVVSNVYCRCWNLNKYT